MYLFYQCIFISIDTFTVCFIWNWYIRCTSQCYWDIHIATHFSIHLGFINLGCPLVWPLMLTSSEQQNYQNSTLRKGGSSKQPTKSFKMPAHIRIWDITILRHNNFILKESYVNWFTPGGKVNSCSVSVHLWWCKYVLTRPSPNCSLLRE